MTVNDRLEQWMKKEGLNANSLAKSIDFSRVAVNNMVSPNGRRTSPSHDFYSRLKATYENIDLNWLITGEGEMYLKNVQVITENDVQPMAAEPESSYDKGQEQNKDIYGILSEIKNGLADVSKRVNDLEKTR